VSPMSPVYFVNHVPGLYPPLTPLCKRGETSMNPEDSSFYSPLSFPKRVVGGEFTDRH